MRRCHLKNLWWHHNSFKVINNSKQIPSTESFWKTLVDLFLRFSRKSFVSVLLGCFQTFWTHCTAYFRSGFINVTVILVIYIYILTNILWFNNSYVQIFFHGSYFAVGKTMIYLIMTRKVFVFFLLMRLGFAFLFV
jgi:hypothetical protein